METMFRLARTNLNRKLLAMSLCFLVLSISLPALAGYQPPARSNPYRGNTARTGTRGCPGIVVPEQRLTAIAPQTYVGQSASTRPTFAWFVPAFTANREPESVRFYLYPSTGDEAVDEQPIYEATLPSTDGIMQYTLPNDAIALEPGKQYRWTVALVCQGRSNEPSFWQRAGAQIEIVEMPNELEQRLSGVQDQLQQANILGESGLWYDAFGRMSSVRATESHLLQMRLLQDLERTEASLSQSSNQNIAGFLKDLQQVVAVLEQQS